MTHKTGRRQYSREARREYWFRVGYQASDDDIQRSEEFNRSLPALGYAGVRMLRANGSLWQLPSSDGAGSYTVRWVGSANDGTVQLWGCSCPAGQHGKPCRHVRLIGEVFDMYAGAGRSQTA